MRKHTTLRVGRLGTAAAGCLIGAGLVAASLPRAAADDTGTLAARVELGRRLFFDPAVSRFGATSCASCHDPEKGFSDPARRSRDETGETPRHSQGLLDLAERPGGFHWDGEFATLRELLDARLASHEVVVRNRLRRLVGHVAAARQTDVAIARGDVLAELGSALTSTSPYGGSPGPITPSGGGTPAAVATPRDGSPRPGAPSVAARLADGGLYDAAFRRAFGSDRIDHGRIADALEAYVLSLRSTDSRYDRAMRGDAHALSDSAERGFELFAGRAGCATCHSVPGTAARAFSDDEFRNTGVSVASSVDGFELSRRAERLRGRPRHADPAAGVPVGDADALVERLRLAGLDRGRAQITLRASDTGRFRVPNLRDVARSAPYMHDGSLATLQDVVRYYDRGGSPNEHLDGRVRPLGLTDGDVADLVAFLESLTGEERPGLGSIGGRISDAVRVRVVGLDGQPLRGARLLVRPCGDRLRGAAEMPAPFEVTTDAGGSARIPFPASTHIALDLPGHELGYGRLIPDTAERVTLVATPLDTVSVVVHSGSDLTRLPSELQLSAVPALSVPDASRRGGVPVVAGRVLRRERPVGTCAALYTAKVADLGTLSSAATVRCATQIGGAFGTFVVDLSGGASEPLYAESERPDDGVQREITQLTRELLSEFAATR